MWSHSVVEHLLCEVMCLGVRDGAAETLLTGVKVVPETMYLGKSSIGGDIVHIGDWFVFSCVYYIIRFIGISSSTTRRSSTTALTYRVLGSMMAWSRSGGAPLLPGAAVLASLTLAAACARFGSLVARRP